MLAPVGSGSSGCQSESRKVALWLNILNSSHTEHSLSFAHLLLSPVFPDVSAKSLNPIFLASSRFIFFCASFIFLYSSGFLIFIRYTLYENTPTFVFINVNCFLYLLTKLTEVPNLIRKGFHRND